MKAVYADDIELVSLDHDEEYELAKFTMDTIAIRWVHGELQELLDRIFYFKCTRGVILKVDEINQLLTFIERYKLPIPNIAESDTDIWATLLDEDFPTNKDKLEESKLSVIRIWREVWETHSAMKRVADGYKKFPGDLEKERTNIDVEAYLAEQDEYERVFWEKVDEVMIEHQNQCTRSEAMSFVGQGHRRGNYDPDIINGLEP